MYDKAAQKDPCLLEFVPDCFKTQEMCNLWSLMNVPDCFKNKTYVLKQLKNIYCYW